MTLHQFMMGRLQALLEDMVIIGSGDGLSPVGDKPLTEPMMTAYQLCPYTDQYQWNYNKTVIICIPWIEFKIVFCKISFILFMFQGNQIKNSAKPGNQNYSNHGEERLS